MTPGEKHAERRRCERVLRRICDAPALLGNQELWEECIDLLVHERAQARTERSELQANLTRVADALEQLVACAQQLGREE